MCIDKFVANWKNVVIAFAMMVATVGVGLAVVAPQDAAEANDIGMCVDHDGDGWGWNGVDSCRIGNVEVSRRGRSNPFDSDRTVTVQCEDSDGDGWGWAETNSGGKRRTATCTGATHTFNIGGFK